VFEIPGVINSSQTAGESNGNFPGDLGMPGIPGHGGMGNGVDGIAAEVLTWLDLPAGVVTLGVNSDDGFRMTAVSLANRANDVFLGAFEGPRGASDTLVKFVVEQAGTYPIRTLWYGGVAPSSLEWFSVTADGRKALINDLEAGGLAAFRGASRPDEVTLTGRRGFTLLSAPVLAGDNSLNVLLPGLPEGATVYTFDGTNQHFESSVRFNNRGWIPNVRIPPGTGFFLHLATPTNVTVRGTRSWPQRLSAW
jgi:hypothetical protein